MDEVITVSG